MPILHFQLQLPELNLRYVCRSLSPAVSSVNYFLFAHSIYQIHIIFRYNSPTFDGVSVFKIEKIPDAFFYPLLNQFWRKFQPNLFIILPIVASIFEPIFFHIEIKTFHVGPVLTVFSYIYAFSSRTP